MYTESNEKTFKQMMRNSAINFSKAGFKVKEIYLDNFKGAIDEREKRVEAIKNSLDVSGRGEEILAAYHSILEAYAVPDYGENDDDVLSDLEARINSMGYGFNSPYIILQYPEDGILIPVIANNLPDIMEFEIFLRTQEEDYQNKDARFATLRSFTYNHSGRKPDLYLSLIEPLVDQFNPDNYYLARKAFIEALYNLSGVVFESWSQWQTSLQYIELMKKTIPPKGLNVDLTKSDNKEEQKENGNDI